MGRERDIKLQEYEISGNRYRELKYFCRQYREKQSQLRSITELSSPSIGSMGGGNKTSDRTADTAVKRAQLQKELETIEQSAIEADAGVYQYIISNVTEGIPWEYLDVPVSRASFYRLRRKYFYLLSEKKS